MNLISRLFEKRGVKGPEDLGPEERVQVERWQAILSTGEITIDRVREFCENQVKLIEGKFKSSPEKLERLVAMHIVYRDLLSLISGEGTKAEREALERYLEDLIKKS